MPNVPDTRRDRIALLAIAIASAIALTLSVSARFGGRSSPAAASGSAAVQDDDLRAEVTWLRQEVDQLRAQTPVGAGPALMSLAKRVEALEGASGVRPPPTRAPDDIGASATPKYVRFDMPTRAIAVTQGPNGALAVKNSDPSLTGKMVVVDAVDENGHVQKVTVVVPPPEK